MKTNMLTWSLADFAKLVELFDAHDVSFVSVTQSFNIASSIKRLTLNVLLSFAQFSAKRARPGRDRDLQKFFHREKCRKKRRNEIECSSFCK